jgi:hypothetical protein
MVSGPIEPLVGTCRLVEMTDQFAGKSIDIDPFEAIDFLTLEIEDIQPVHHANVGAIAVENVAAHDRPPAGYGIKMRLLDENSETIRTSRRRTLRGAFSAVARMEQSEIRDHSVSGWTFLDCATLHPGYAA